MCVCWECVCVGVSRHVRGINSLLVGPSLFLAFIALDLVYSSFTWFQPIPFLVGKVADTIVLMSDGFLFQELALNLILCVYKCRHRAPEHREIN